MIRPPPRSTLLPYTTLSRSSTVQCAAQVPAANDAAVVATDNCGGTVTVTHGADVVTPGSCPGKFTVTRVYTAADACGNSSTCTQTITVNDTTPPVITQCAPDSTVQCAAQVPAANDAAVVANHNLGGTVAVTHRADAIAPGRLPR